MKYLKYLKEILFLSFLLSFSSFTPAYNQVFNANGITDDGELITGAVFTNQYEDVLSGTLTDENGYVHSFEGNWVGNGQVSGQTDNGTIVTLRVN